MKKISKILAAQMGCDDEKADQTVLRMHERLRKRAERTGKKMHLGSPPDEQTVRNAFESSDEVEAFDTLISVLEELLEDVEFEEVDRSASKLWN
jgi:polysaccharide deacetylase 2 family uncharacterized protein YibQ